jgi:hypothetical protein
MRKLEDLRFAIGLFFTLVGLLLLVAGWQSETADAAMLNSRAGIGILIFGVLALAASFMGKKTDALE